MGDRQKKGVGRGGGRVKRSREESENLREEIYKQKMKREKHWVEREREREEKDRGRAKERD